MASGIQVYLTLAHLVYYLDNTKRPFVKVPNRKCLQSTNPNKILSLGSGCGTVGKAVASNTREPQFDSQHRLRFICQLCNIEKTKVKEKRPG